MSIPDWIATEDWENCYFDGVRCPGMVRVSIRCKGGLNVKKGKGSKLARIHDEGVHPLELTFEIVLLPADLDEFETLVVDIARPRAGNTSRRPVAVVHPNANVWGVGFVMLDDIESPMPTPGGTWNVKLTAMEWTNAPKKVKKKTDAPKNEAEGWDNVDALTAALRQKAAERAHDGLFPDNRNITPLNPAFLFP